LHRKRLVAGIAAALIASLTAASAIAGAATVLTGAGSTLVAPLMAHWSPDFKNRTGITVFYGAVGSGTGITDISQRVVKFGASDAPLTSDQAAACHSCVMIPWALTATAIGFHVNNIHSIRLSGPVLAKIYLGQITKWNAPQIKALNKRTNLPNLRITPVFRSDGSGDTYAFTDFMSRVSSAWAHRVGTATAVSFPAGTGAKGNSGVAAVVKATNGTIGYMAASFLITQGIPASSLENQAGNFEFPNLSNIESAAQTVTNVPSSNALHIVNPPASASAAYPLSTFTYMIAPRSSSVAGQLSQFVRYAVGPGQRFGPALDFAKLPKVVVNAALKAAKGLHG
jgi:phosphate transport system substrate-binding protein